jgi:hypothetical protein
MSIKFCPTCRYFLFLENQVRVNEKTQLKTSELFRICRACGYSEQEEQGCLILETNLQEKVNEEYKILLNEFTRLDPTLPHVKNIQCPNDKCRSNTGEAERDVIYMKYDAVNLKYLYICNVDGCNMHWRSR